MCPTYLSPEREACFPSLKRPEYEVTSNEDFGYNCIAHAADKRDAWWWPTEDETEGIFWPKSAPREETLEAFVAAYAAEGYVVCDSPELEAGFEKVAIYLTPAG